MSAFGYVPLPTGQSDARTVKAADGGTLWTLCPPQTASTVNIAGTSVTVPAEGLADKRTITADTAVYGAADGMTVLVK